MSYSTSGYMHCEPFVYWGDLPKDWAEYVRKVDVGDFLFKLRYMNEALAYLDKVEFVRNPNHDVSDHELELDWFLSRRGKISFCSPNDWWERTVLFPLARNVFPFVVLNDKEIEELIEELGEELREEVLEDVPGPFEDEAELEEYVRESLDVWDLFDNLDVWDLKLRSPDPYFEKELEAKNFDGDGHIGSDALLHFLAKAGVVNRDFRDWMVSYHLIGEDGEEFSHAKKIVGNEVKDPHQASSSW
jgi:hypothetical protein